MEALPSRRAGSESDANLQLLLVSDAVEHRARSPDPDSGLGEIGGTFPAARGRAGSQCRPQGLGNRADGFRSAWQNLRYLLGLLLDVRTAADVVGRVAPEVGLEPTTP